MENIKKKEKKKVCQIDFHLRSVYPGLFQTFWPTVFLQNMSSTKLQVFKSITVLPKNTSLQCFGYLLISQFFFHCKQGSIAGF